MSSSETPNKLVGASGIPPEELEDLGAWGGEGDPSQAVAALLGTNSNMASSNTPTTIPTSTSLTTTIIPSRQTMQQLLQTNASSDHLVAFFENFSSYNEQLRKEHDELQTILSALTADHLAVVATLSAKSGVEHEVETLRTKCSNLESQLVSSLATNQKLMEEIKAQGEKHSAEHSRSLEELSLVTAQLLEGQKQIQTLQRNNLNLQIELNVNKRDMLGFREQMQELRDEIERLKLPSSTPGSSQSSQSTSLPSLSTPSTETVEEKFGRVVLELLNRGIREIRSNLTKPDHFRKQLDRNIFHAMTGTREDKTSDNYTQLGVINWWPMLMQDVDYLKSQALSATPRFYEFLVYFIRRFYAVGNEEEQRNKCLAILQLATPALWKKNRNNPSFPF